MADTKITALTPDASPTSDDLVPTVNDPGGTPANRKVTAGNLITKAHGLSDSTVVGVSGGVLTSGTDVAVTDGGTGASDASGARTNLGLVIGTNVQAYDADLTTLSTAFTSASALGPASLDLHEDTDNGTNKITITGQSALAGDQVLTLPDATDTLVGKATTDTLTNKTFDANGTGNSLSNVEVADLAASAVVTAAEGLATSDNDTSLPTTAAVIDGLDTKQPLDSDLTTIAGLTATTNNIIQSVSSAWASRTPTEVTATLDAMVGDSGAGGTKGLAPAPSAGDAAANKYLKADGTWAAVSSSGQSLYTYVLATSGGDYTDLATALAAMSAGDTLFVREGTYTLTAATTSALANIKIIGENPASTIIALASYTLTLSGANVTVTGLKFTSQSGSTGNIVLGSGGYANMHNCWLYSSNTTSTFLTLYSYARVHECLIQTTNTTNLNVVYYVGTRASVHNCYFHLAGVSTATNNAVIGCDGTNNDFSNNVIYVAGGVNSGGYPFIKAEGVTEVKNNYYAESGTRMTFVYSKARTVIANNRIDNCYTGIDLVSGNELHEVVDNEIINFSTSGYGIHVQTGAGNNVVGNRIVGSGSSTAIRVLTAHNNISNNNIYNGQYGIRVTAGATQSNVSGNKINMVSTSLYGIEVGGNHCNVSGNQISGPGTTGGRCIYLDAARCTITGNNCYNAQKGIQSSTNALYCTITGNQIDTADTAGLDIGSDYSLWTGNVLRNVTTDIAYGTHNKSNTVINNYGDGVNAIHETKVVWMKNTSGGALAAGDVVVWKAVAAGNEITTTTTAGDDKVFGVCTEAITDTSFGPVQVLGKTTLLKADGTTDIAVGDFLTTFTTAGIAQKAAAGDQAFAIALEAYTTDDSNGVIDALIIEPRLI